VQTQTKEAAALAAPASNAPPPSKAGAGDELFASELKRRAEAERVQADLETTPVTPVPVLRADAVAALAAEKEARDAERKAEEAAIDRDDASIPPVLVAAKPEPTDDHADRFFAEGDSQSSIRIAVVTDEAEEEPNPELKWRLSPAVQQRRSRYTKIAQRVVGALAVVALIGLGKAALTRAPSADVPLKALANAAAQPLARAEEEVKAAAPKAEEPKPEQPQVQAGAEVKADEPAAAAAAPAPVTDPAAAPSAEPSSDPKADKKAAQQAIERGDNKTAVEMGERVLEADPSDAEVWLIVGAAYQAMGQNAKAHQAFASCVQKAKHGPIGECGALR
jgi:tetratricopeptide (TPR) repeat protein